MEGNLCWNCTHIATCHPNKRPKNQCDGFVRYENPITRQQIAEILEISPAMLARIISVNGTRPIVERLKRKGIYVRVEKITVYQKFYRRNHNDILWENSR